ncbi:unnamed protein product [Brassica rapa]|uniref:Uncharacterized protein n=1 Tax=Brassica campestris TaxID=3711 RepID=A0A3P6BWE2_BRACM|nr:unnamed protein product [Brassica rapa]VDD02955.1 unnamed protein product [Brassica rapa]
MNGGVVRSLDGKGFVLWFSDSARRKVPRSRSCQPVMCALLWYAVRLYIPASVVLPPVERGTGPVGAEASHKIHSPVLMLLSVCGTRILWR